MNIERGARMQTSKLSSDETIVGVVLRGSLSRIERIIKSLEKDETIRLVYVRRANPGAFLIIVETRKVRGGGMLNAEYR